MVNIFLIFYLIYNHSKLNKLYVFMLTFIFL